MHTVDLHKQGGGSAYGLLYGPGLFHQKLKISRTVLHVLIVV